MAAQLRTYFAECGMQDTGAIAGRQTTEFIQSQGFTSIDDFNGLKQADIGRLVKSFNASAPTTGAIGFMVQKKLEALAFWVTEHKKRQLPLDAANWNAAAIEEARRQADIAHERRLNPQVPKRVEKIQTGIDWYTWNEKFENYLSSIRGVEDVPLTYVIRRDKPPGWDPETDSSNEEEKLIYQVALFGAAFEDDNKVVFSKLMEVTLGEPSYEWIRRFEATKDGRQAMITLRSHCEGNDYVELRITEADRIIRDAHYNNERAYPFESYVTQLQKAYTIYEQTNQPWPDRQKVKRMVDKINIVGHFLISHAKAHVKDVLHDDWIAAVSYMKTKVAEAFPGVTGTSPKDRSGRRFIRETNSGGRFGGRGRGGRFGRGRGRGGGDYQGRGGRGGKGGYASKAELLSEGRIPKEVNGVNTANIFRSFSPEEWRALGPEWQSKIRNRRESAPERGTGGRNVSEARITNETQGDGNARPNETADNGKGNDGPKGGKAGLGFGRGAYYQK